MPRVIARRLESVAKRQSLPRTHAPLPTFVKPQLCLLREDAPSGGEWIHEIKYDGYRIAARIDGGRVRLLTRSGLDWTDKYPATAAFLTKLPCERAYIDGELCALDEKGITSFAAMQAASDSGASKGLVYFAFDLLHLDGRDLRGAPLLERKKQLATLLAAKPAGVRYSEHFELPGPDVLKGACEIGAEGVVSKRIDRPYVSGDRGIWVKSKCLNRQEFVIVGWTDPEGSRPSLGALLLGYYDEAGKLLYAGRAGTGMSGTVLGDLRRRLQPLAVTKMPLAVAPPKKSRFGSRLELSKIHWVAPKLVAEVTFLTWTGDGLLRHVVYQGLREDKAALAVRRESAKGLRQAD
jgi:DNA ligase D-like protein (predicted ligase)